MFTHSRLNLLNLLMILLCCCLLLGAVPVQSGDLPQPSPGGFIIVPPPLSGGDYRLMETTWRVTGAAAAGAYRLDSVDALRQTGNGCCCVLLPCVLKQ